jgi:hypothetical protein
MMLRLAQLQDEGVMRDERTSAWFAETDRPTNTDQRFIRIGYGKFIHAPRLVFTRFLKFVSRSVNVLKIKIKPKWVSAGTGHPSTASVRCRYPPFPFDSMR